MEMKVGPLAEMLEAAAKQGITIAAGCVFPRLGGRVAHVAVLATANKAATAGHLVNVSYFGAQGEVIRTKKSLVQGTGRRLSIKSRDLSSSCL